MGCPFLELRKAFGGLSMLLLGRHQPKVLEANLLEITRLGLFPPSVYVSFLQCHFAQACEGKKIDGEFRIL